MRNTQAQHIICKTLIFASLCFFTGNQVSLADSNSEQAEQITANSNTYVELRQASVDLSGLSPEDLNFLQEHLDSLAKFLALEKTEINDAKHLEEAHDAFEGEEEGEAKSDAKVVKTTEKVRNFFSEWIQNYNFKRIFYSVNRYYFLDKNIPVRQSLKDLVTLFCISHGTEVAYGVASVAVSLLKGYSMKVVLANAGIGLVIAMPGSDPLCFLILGTYIGSLKFKALRPYKYAVRYLRLGIASLSKSAYSVSGLRRLVEVFITKQSALQLISSRLHGFDLQNLHIKSHILKDKSEGYILEVFNDGQTEFKVVFRNNLDGSLAVVSVQSVLDQGKVPARYQNILKAISGNLHNAVVDSFASIGVEHLPFFIKSLKAEGGVAKVEMSPGALRIKPKSTRRSKLCGPVFE